MVRVREVTLPAKRRVVVATSRRRPRRSSPAFGLDAVVGKIGDPQFVLAAVACAVLAMTHATDPTTSVVTRFTEWLKGIPSTKWIGEFLANHAAQTVGAGCYLAVALLAAPPRTKWTWALCAVGLAFLIPEHSVYQYACLALVGCLYLRTSNSQMKTLVVIAGVLAYLAF